MFIASNDDIQQLVFCSENDSIIDIDTTKQIYGLVHLMASYYVFNVEYPKTCKNTF